jgi:hypothetical protein
MPSANPTSFYWAVQAGNEVDVTCSPAAGSTTAGTAKASFDVQAPQLVSAGASYGAIALDTRATLRFITETKLRPAE